MSAAPDVVHQKLETLPREPGVYLFRGHDGRVLYVGKAKSLRARVRSYFAASGGDGRFFVPLLPELVADLETVVVASEKEALILENELIKQHRPRFNVKLRDDKTYLSLKLATGHPWPRLVVVRKDDGSPGPVFGPFDSATAARRTLHVVNKHFQLRTCSDADFANRQRPCLQHQIKRCPAPCVLDVDPRWYATQVRLVELFLESRHEELRQTVEARMREAAIATQYELAAVYRDQLRAIDRVQEEQRIVSDDGADRDVLGLHRDGERVEIAHLRIRGGRLVDVRTIPGVQAIVDDEALVASYILQAYAGAGGGESHDDDRDPDREPGHEPNREPAREPDGEGRRQADGEAARETDREADRDAEAESDAPEATRAAVPVPPEILVPCEPEGRASLEAELRRAAGRKVAIVLPKRGAKSELLKLANDNAAHAFQEKRRANEDVEARLAKVRDLLRLPSLPRRVECCDISHLGGGDTVGAIVHFLDGAPDKSRYRSFHVRDEVAERRGGDDYGAMFEVLSRRFRRGRGARSGEANEAWELPDLFVVDGGRGQVGVAVTAARDLGLHDLPIVGLAKERELGSGERVVDRLYLPGQKNPIELRSHAAALGFLAHLRDEAHRFANRARERLGKVRRFRSALDDVKGVSGEVKRRLVERFGSVRGILQATDAELGGVEGVGPAQIGALRRGLAPAVTRDG
jgi:excinuclease ABC subunit C